MAREHRSQVGFKSSSAAENIASASASVSVIERQVIVEGWTLGVAQGSDGPEPRIRDVDLGERLKLKDPRKIRQLIKSLATAGIINPFAVMHAAGITGGRRATEFWLTEDEALFVAMRSDAEGAILLQREMVRVFMLARRGLLPQQTPELLQFSAQVAEISKTLAQFVATMSAMVAANTQRIEALEARTMPDMGVNGRISAAEEKRIRLAFQQIATLNAGPRVDGDKEQNKRWARARLIADHKTRRAIRLPMGRKWTTLDTADLNAAWLCIDELREDARRVAAQRPKQGALLS